MQSGEIVAAASCLRVFSARMLHGLSHADDQSGGRLVGLPYDTVDKLEKFYNHLLGKLLTDQKRPL